MFIAALFTIAKTWKQPIDGCMDKEVVIYIHTMEYYSAFKKKEILSFMRAWMDPKGIMLSEINQTEKDKYCVISLVCGT